jgi:hypothetical protein
MAWLQGPWSCWMAEHGRQAGVRTAVGLSTMAETVLGKPLDKSMQVLHRSRVLRMRRRPACRGKRTIDAAPVLSARRQLCSQGHSRSGERCEHHCRSVGESGVNTHCRWGERCEHHCRSVGESGLHTRRGQASGVALVRAGVGLEPAAADGAAAQVCGDRRLRVDAGVSHLL